jgi:hypothetical protein
MNDLIHISYYNELNKSFEKEKSLLDLIYSIKNEGSFDILLTSTSVVPDNIISKVDYHFYNINDTLIKWDELSLFRNYYNIGDSKIISRYPIPPYHGVSVVNQIYLAHTLAQKMGYIKVHYIDYDNEIKNFSELYENSKLLDDYDYVLYKNDDTLTVILSYFFSYNTKSNLSDLKYDNIENMVKVKSTEKIIYEISKYSSYYKHIRNLNENIKGNNSVFFVKKGLNVNNFFPYYDSESEEIFFLAYNNDNDDDVYLELYFNDKYINKTIPKNNWKIINLGKYHNEEIKMKVIFNNQKFKEIHIDKNIKTYSYKK